MARSYPLEIVTLKRTVFSDDVECVTVPGGLGYLGVLAGHAPLLTNVEIGVITIKSDGASEQKMAVGEGFLVVTPKTTSLLVDIDVLRAETALKRAIARLKLAGAL